MFTRNVANSCRVASNVPCEIGIRCEREIYERTTDRDTRQSCSAARLAAMAVFRPKNAKKMEIAPGPALINFKINESGSPHHTNSYTLFLHCAHAVPTIAIPMFNSIHNYLLRIRRRIRFIRCVHSQNVHSQCTPIQLIKLAESGIYSIAANAPIRWNPYLEKGVRPRTSTSQFGGNDSFAALCGFYDSIHLNSFRDPQTPQTEMRDPANTRAIYKMYSESSKPSNAQQWFTSLSSGAHQHISNIENLGTGSFIFIFSNYFFLSSHSASNFFVCSTRAISFPYSFSFALWRLGSRIRMPMPPYTIVCRVNICNLRQRMHLASHPVYSPFTQSFNFIGR